MRTDAELLAREHARQAEADAAVAALGLDEALKAIGQPTRTGSSALGVLVKRDVDITVVCPQLTPEVREQVVELTARLARRERVRQAVFRDDAGAFNREPESYPDGLYVGIRYRADAAEDAEWNFDIWFVDEPERQPDLGHLEALPPRLTEEARIAILRIKEAWATRPEYGREVNGARIYGAVLDDGVRSVEAFEDWFVRNR
jgi:hypothetical protein